ncbi:MAG TPA: hypothetical protein VHS96_10300, partial [Bacteroidia bacterium]|nr:hypothetical protein [Bacteroidia bacterium]
RFLGMECVLPEQEMLHPSAFWRRNFKPADCIPRHSPESRTLAMAKSGHFGALRQFWDDRLSGSRSTPKMTKAAVLATAALANGIRFKPRDYWSTNLITA